MRELIAEAVKFTVTVENKSYASYRRWAATATDPAGRRIFERLAHEKSGHIDSLLAQHPEIRYEMLMEPAGRNYVAECRFDEATGRGLFDLLRLALLEKRSSIDLYATLSRSFKEPSISRIFEAALSLARNEFKSINALYLKADIPTALPKCTRPPRRTHFRGELHHACPNKHTELFFSMLDSGRS